MALAASRPFLLVMIISLTAALLPGPGWAADHNIQSHFSVHGVSVHEFSVHGQGSAQAVDHGAWTAILQTYVSQSPDGINRFDYGGITPTDRAVLAAYIGELSATPITTFSRQEQLAFWVNLYNALIVQVVLDHYPVRSIRQIKFGRLFASGPWRQNLVVVDGFDLNLDVIENDILRTGFGDPRVHYALNCASLGCPNLATEAFEGRRVDAQLDATARAFINHPRAVRVEDGRLVTSSIYVWYGEDFGRSDDRIIEHLRRYADAELATQLDGATRLARHEYDWALNDIDQGRGSE